MNEHDQIADALTDYILQALSQHESVHVPGLGTFSVAHEESYLAEHEDGTAVMQPPRDTIHFEPEAR
ncbi:MAG: HU family DNA-binding protein [Bacteroidota bacterium]